MRTVLAVALCLMVGACDSSTGPKEPHLGRYVLQSIGGEPLPHLLFDFLGVKVEVLAMSLELKSGESFEALSTSRRTEDGVVTTETDTETGEYTLEGTTLTLISDLDPEPVIGTLVGDTYTFTDERPMTWVFVKV